MEITQVLSILEMEKRLGLTEKQVRMFLTVLRRAGIFTSNEPISIKTRNEEFSLGLNVDWLISFLKEPNEQIQYMLERISE